MTEPVTFDSAFTRMKKVVYKQRIRVKDWIQDFDKLRSGFVHPNHFLSALSGAKLDKELTPAELQVIADAYTVQRSPSLIMVDYKTFLDDLNLVFTTPHLEKTPLADVSSDPAELLDRTRYQCSSRVLDEGEEVCDEILNRLKDIISKRGTPVKPFFDDAAASDNSAKLFGHVTLPQFRQCLSTKLDLEITEEEAQLLHKKFHNEDKTELMNYVAFSNMIDPANAGPLPMHK